MHAPLEQEGFRLTGRMVFACLVVFFATVVAVNVAMIRAAISTFGGLETAESLSGGARVQSRPCSGAGAGWSCVESHREPRTSIGRHRRVEREAA